MTDFTTVFEENEENRLSNMSFWKMDAAVLFADRFCQPRVTCSLSRPGFSGWGQARIPGGRRRSSQDAHIRTGRCVDSGFSECPGVPGPDATCASWRTDRETLPLVVTSQAGNGAGSKPGDISDVLTQYRGLSWR